MPNPFDSNPYIVASSPSYTAPVINWFGGRHGPENVGQQTQQSVQQQSSPPPAGSQPGPTQWGANLARGLRQFLGLEPPAPQQPTSLTPPNPGAAIYNPAPPRPQAPPQGVSSFNPNQPGSLY